MDQFSYIVYDDMSFLITESPTVSTTDDYINLFKQYNVKHIIRVCSSLYDEKQFENEDFIVHNLEFPDGHHPSKPIVKAWHIIVNDAIRNHTTIAVHCIAGLGRAPVMVALSLIEAGMSYRSAIQYIRDRRRGSFNGYQMRFLKDYKPHSKSCILL